MKILNLHGFMGEADNKNYKALCEIFPSENIISPKILIQEHRFNLDMKAQKKNHHQ